MRIAAVDAGTNTILMLIADVQADGTLHIVRDEHAIARLGKGVDASGNISEEAIERGCTILRHYALLCQQEKVDIRVGVATSAIRDAINKTEVLRQLSAAYGGPLNAISGEEEALLCFRGTVDSEDEQATVLDIGGGSTELVSRSATTDVDTQELKEPIQRISMDIGAVRITERYFRSLPPTLQEREAAIQGIRAALEQIPIEQITATASVANLYAVAGTPTTLAAIAQEIREFDWHKVDGYILTADYIRQICSRLLQLTHDELIAIPGVHPERADILPAGALILEEILAYMNQKRCVVSAKGLRFGVLKAAAAMLKHR